MYSESDIDAAVGAGALTAQAADDFRTYIARMRVTPAVDEESFRLLTGFNDIFVSIAIVLLLVATSWIGGTIASPFAGLGVAAVAWGLAEYFTARRRMALPSIVLLIAFVGGVAATFAAPIAANADAVNAWLKTVASTEDGQAAIAALIAAVIAAVTAAAAFVHWRRFMVPITVAAAAVAVVGVGISLIVALIPVAREAIYPLVFVAGLAMFAFAMRWDMSDRERRTRRADVAFWLHLAAAPMIAHSLFNLIGVFGGDVDAGRALLVLLLYIGFAVVALAVDRRALLVSSLVYVLYAMYALFQTAGAVELSAAFTALVIGSALLLLSAFWQPVRARVVAMLGDIGGRLPPVQLAH
ncbi:hypothetical protein GGQ80_000694 [Sphingomonas jinjuensis]|uniref:DUF2157 domain-containing protein n=1 Tax=Sphingomonas jinjuensis TaxID=535907 RepID=A0A840F934_9SPHN|nr:hypothetical protein [Sphingomonas jinjuensis]MBB4152806.1 hypothetical protein [Sphingomonas jinjuensis]